MESSLRKKLLRIAREAICRSLGCGAADEYEKTDGTPEPGLLAHKGAFVTLRRRGVAPGAPGSLRGCIGRFTDDAPLYRSIARLACESAFNDSRFPPVRASEMPDLCIEISVLTEPRPVAAVDSFKVGRDGIILRCGYRSAVFLPHVAVEQKWDRTEVLEHLCEKAGLPSDAWKRPDASFATFQAEVFAEDGV